MDSDCLEITVFSFQNIILYTHNFSPLYVLKKN